MQLSIELVANFEEYQKFWFGDVTFVLIKSISVENVAISTVDTFKGTLDLMFTSSYHLGVSWQRYWYSEVIFAKIYCLTLKSCHQSFQFYVIRINYYIWTRSVFISPLPVDTPCPRATVVFMCELYHSYTQRCWDNMPTLQDEG